MWRRRTVHPDMSLNDLDYSITYELCTNFDIDRSWEPLAAVIGYKTSDIQIFELECRRPDGSPAKKLLWDWGTRGGTVRDLYNKLGLINRTQSMRLLEHIMNLDKKKVGNEKGEADMRENEKESREGNEKKSNNLLCMPSSESMSFNPNSLPVPKMKKCSTSSSSLTDNASVEVDVNLNTSNEKSDKNSDKQKIINKLGLVPDQGAASMEISKCRADGPPSTKGNLGAASSSMRNSFERARSVVEEEYGSQTSCMSQLNQSEKEIVRALMSTPHYTYKELSQATDGFNAMKSKLGQGKFGSVYMGLVKNTKCAIKKLTQKRNKNDEETSSSHLAAELKALSRYRHENIVSLYGYALDGDEVCLVYQFMHNGSLDDCLHRKNGHIVVLSWLQRLSILCGAACGLQFLHSVDIKPVIHGDIKSANILLDRHFEAKIGDLGLAQQATGGEVAGKFTHITKKNTRIHDYKNQAYYSPEIKRGNSFSIKGDTYAFGVVMFECLTGQEPFDENREGGTDEKYLVGYIEDMIDSNPKINKQKVFEDKKIQDNNFPTTMFIQLFDLAERCIQKRKIDRPEMVEVYKDLEKIQCDYEGEPYVNIQKMDVSYDSGVRHTPGLKSPCSLPLSKGHEGQVDQIVSPIDCLPKGQPLPNAFRLQKEIDERNEKQFKGPLYENVEMIKKGGEFLDSDPKKLAEIEKSDKEFKSSDEKLRNENGDPKSDPSKDKAIDEFDKANVGKTENRHKDGESINEALVYPSDPKKAAIIEMREEQEEVLKNVSSEPHDYVNVSAKITENHEVNSELDKGKLADKFEDSDVGFTEDVDQVGYDLENEFTQIAQKACKGDSSMMDIFDKFDCLKESANKDYTSDPNFDEDDNLDFNFHFDFENDDSETSTITDSINTDFENIDVSEIDDNDLFACENQESNANVPTESADKKFDASIQSHQNRIEKYKGMAEYSSNDQTIKDCPAQSVGQHCVADESLGKNLPGFHGNTGSYGNQNSHFGDQGQMQAKQTSPGNIFGAREPTEGECYV